MGLRDDLRECRARNAQLNTQVKDLTAKLAECQTNRAEDAKTIGDLREQLALAQHDLSVCQQESAKLAAELKACQDAGTPQPEPEPPMQWTETLRDSDGQTVAQALAQMKSGQSLRLVGEFATPELHFPASGITLGCDPGGAKLVPVGTSQDDIVGVKTGPTTGARDITLLNLLIDAQQKAKNCVAGWMGLTIKGCELTGGKMTGFHAFNGGLPEDADILVEDTELHHNGSEAEIGHGAAGSKIFNINGVTFRRVHSHHNNGNGLWADHNCGRVEYLDSVMEENTRRGAFYEKCGRHGDPYPKSFVYGEYLPQFIAKGGKVIYEGGWNILGCTIQNNQAEGGLFVASVHFRMSDTTFGGNGANGTGMLVRNDENRMNPKAYDRPDGSSTEPGWMVEDVVIDKSSCTLNGDAIQIGSNVPADKVRIQ